MSLARLASAGGERGVDLSHFGGCRREVGVVVVAGRGRRENDRDVPNSELSGVPGGA